MRPDGQVKISGQGQEQQNQAADQADFPPESMAQSQEDTPKVEGPQQVFKKDP